MQVWKINEISNATEQLSNAFLDSLAGCVAVVEDVVHNGAFAEAIEEAILSRTGFRMLRFDTGNRFLPHGSVREIYQYCGIDGASVAARIRDFLTDTK